MKKFAIAAASLFVLSGVAACGESAADKAAEKRADAIEATGEASSADGWAHRLYRPVEHSAASRPATLRLIPYYAWANRGPSEMTVWISRR